MAKQYSEDIPVTKVVIFEAGIWKGDTVPQFEHAILPLHKDKLVNLFAHHFGWHILQVMNIH